MKQQDSQKFKTTIGGQAIIEGIVMKGPEQSATVVRKADGELVIVEKPANNFVKRHKICRLPFVRGVVNLVIAMKDGFEAIHFSSSYFMDGEEESPGRFERFLTERFGSKKVESFFLGAATVFGVLIPVGLFILLPTLLAGFLRQLDLPTAVYHLTEGLLRMGIFLLFLYFTSKLKDIHRTFEYHGAEHKTIHCYEAGKELAVENIRPLPKAHPRCGTSFLFVVMIISIFVFSFLSWSNPWIRMALRLLFLPVVVGIAYEANRFVGRYDNWLTKILRVPGVWLQRFTTFEPDDSMIEVAIEGLKRVIPEKKGADSW